MEVNAVRRQERIRQTEKAGQAVGDPASVRTPARGAGADRLTLSKEAIAHLKEQNRLFQERLDQDMQRKARERIGEEDSGDGMLDALAERLKVMQKCQKIASRIMAGDKVPPQDEMYLMQNDPTAYKLAMAARKIKKDPKEWESEADKEEDAGRTASAESAGGCEEPAAPEPSGETGGGDAPAEGE